MRNVASALGFAAALLIAGVTEAPAVAFNTVSGLGSFNNTCLVAPGCAGGFVAIEPNDPADGPWTPNVGSDPTGPIWVSYADTGLGGSVVPANAAGPLTPANATQTFQMDVPAATASLTLTIWGDDTVGVRLNNDPNPANYVLAPSAAGGMFSPGTPLFIPLDPNMVYTIQFDTFQLGGFTYGLMVQGDAAVVPEPATLLLVGSALAAAGVVSRKRLHKKQQLG